MAFRLASHLHTFAWAIFDTWSAAGAIPPRPNQISSSFVVTQRAAGKTSVTKRLAQIMLQDRTFGSPPLSDWELL